MARQPARAQVIAPVDERAGVGERAILRDPTSSVLAMITPAI
ncbi:hypothetical protein [Enhygromyxa salina]|nr:hypothetical protein [Enhygromyxa salina]